MPPRCLFCGQPEVAELFEVWGPREFMIETCCEGMHEAVNDFLAEDPKAAADWLNGLTDSQGLPAGLKAIRSSGARRIVNNEGQLVIDWHLEITSIEQRAAKLFIREHHRHCPPPAGWRFGAAVRNGSEVIGVVMVGRPVAPGFNPKLVVEVNRLCVRGDIAEGLSWNACSMLYGWAAREAKKRGFAKIVTYVLATEAAVTLRAAGWTQEARVKGRSWNTPSRPRVDKMEIIDKVRWAKVLRAVPATELTRQKPVKRAAQAALELLAA